MANISTRLFNNVAAARRNPIASQTTMKTLQLVTARWLHGARDRDGGHKRRMAAAAACQQQSTDNERARIGDEEELS